MQQCNNAVDKMFYHVEYISVYAGRCLDNSSSKEQNQSCLKEIREWENKNLQNQQKNHQKQRPITVWIREPKYRNSRVRQTHPRKRKENQKAPMQPPTTHTQHTPPYATTSESPFPPSEIWCYVLERASPGGSGRACPGGIHSRWQSSQY